MNTAWQRPGKPLSIARRLDLIAFLILIVEIAPRRPALREMQKPLRKRQLP
ncbi:hypothetical protein [Vandammella animalimorsus]|uniref:hypothetical protein n=1 Tax=Vandammella animalimorsus TaxID=2029117 RepID=UPI001554F592|nr:hypothetical protein [Vandammella animalimorsus]